MVGVKPSSNNYYAWYLPTSPPATLPTCLGTKPTTVPAILLCRLVELGSE